MSITFKTGSWVLRCSFCGKSQREVEELIAGPKVYICNECLNRFSQILQTPTSRLETKQKTENCCSFCGKSEQEISKMFSQSAANICDECIELCQDIFREELEQEKFWKERLDKDEV